MNQRKYKKPLEQTRCIDDWKCPWCREKISKIPERMQETGFSIFDGEFEETCPNCGKKSKLFISPEFFAQPIEDDESEE